MRYESLRVFLSIFAHLGLNMEVLDAKTAFLNGELEETIFIRQPEGFVQPGSETKVCQLRKSIYGLKQAPRVWNQKFDHFITKFGLQRSVADPCVYFRNQNGDVLILAIWVDDGLLCGSNPITMSAMLQHLQSGFQITSGPAERFVGLQINRDLINKQLFLSLPDYYIVDLLEKFRMVECQPRDTPADPHTKLSEQMSPTSGIERETMKSTPYREAVGSLQYAATTCRPDIYYAVGQAAQHCENPGKAHWEAVKRIIAYLKATPRLGLCFDGSCPGDIEISGLLCWRRRQPPFHLRIRTHHQQRTRRLE